MHFKNIKNMQSNDYISKYIVMLIFLMGVVTIGYN